MVRLSRDICQRVQHAHRAEVESYPSDLFPQRCIEGSSSGDDLREAGGPREGPTKPCPGSHIGHPMKRLRPPLVPVYPQPRHWRRIVYQQPYLFRQCQPSDQVTHPNVYRMIGLTEHHVPGNSITWIAGERRS